MILLDEFKGVKRPGKMYLECEPRRKDPLKETPEPFDDLREAATWARLCPYEPIYKACDMKGNIFVCTTTPELIARLMELNPRIVWLYNASLPLSWIDAWLLKQKTWKRLDKGQLQNKTYKDLSGVSGQRYRLTIAQNYKGKGKGEDRHKRLRHVNFYDLMNFCAGGLETCYSSMGSPELPEFTDIHRETRRNAVIMGLALSWYDKKLAALSGVHIDKTTPEAMTIGGIAKGILLENMYHKGRKASNLKEFRKDHPMTPALDRWYRSKWLYTGAVVYLSEEYKGGALPEVWRYDQNSKYGHEIEEMPEIIGKSRVLTWNQYQKRKDNGNVFAIAVSDIDMHLLPGMAPIWKDPHLHINRRLYKYTASGEDDLLLFFDFELDELYNWYDIELSCEYVLEMEARQQPGFKTAIDGVFSARTEAKESGDKIFNNVCKLLIVCISGKLAEDPYFPRWEKYIDIDGTIKQRKIGEDETKQFLDIRQGAYITAHGRTEEMRDIRISLPNPEKQLIYADTDCMHSTVKPEGLNIDPKALGAYKDECGGEPFTMSIYVEKKIYFNSRPECTGEMRDYDIRTAGTPREAAKKQLEGLDAVGIAEAFQKGFKVPCSVSVAVRGGYVKVPYWKRLAMDNGIIWQNYGQEIDLIKREELGK